jgi:hypothetical protein
MDRPGGRVRVISNRGRRRAGHRTSDDCTCGGNLAWSRLRARWRDLLAPSVAGRVDAHMAGYRKAYDGRGRVWLTVDGHEIVSFCEFEFENAWRDEGRREGATRRPFTNSAQATIRATGVRNKADLLDAMGKCIGSSIEQLLSSPDPLVRALTMLDRRLGKRRLTNLDVRSAHPLVAELHHLRCEAEAVRRQV